jgi:hypothetical protein
MSNGKKWGARCVHCERRAQSPPHVCLRVGLRAVRRHLGRVWYSSQPSQASSRQPGCIWPGQMHAGGVVCLPASVEPVSAGIVFVCMHVSADWKNRCKDECLVPCMHQSSSYLLHAVVRIPPSNPTESYIHASANDYYNNLEIKKTMIKNITIIITR